MRHNSLLSYPTAMIYRYLLSLSLLPLACSLLPAQSAEPTDSFALDREYRFNEGVYFSFASLVANRPDRGWDEVGGSMVQFPDDYRVQIGGMKLSGHPIDGPIYALVLEGFPYRLVRRSEQNALTEFVMLRIRGRLAYYEFETTEVKSIVMRAYNPANGRPFREGMVDKREVVRNGRLLNFEDGGELTFDRENLIAMTSDRDPDLAELLLNLDPRERDYEEKLRKAVKIFDDRHPLYLPNPPGDGEE